MNPLSASDLLIAAIGVILRDKRLWIHESAQSSLELPGYIVAKSQEAVIHLNRFLSELGLQDLPQESLYLTAVNIDQKPSRKATALVRIIRFVKKPEFELPNHRWATLGELLENEQASSLTKAVASRLIVAH
ncbi:MAG: hypothetical protein ACFE9D_04055 [Promethearchaeota archaeon]